MTKTEKVLARMRANPRGWPFEDLKDLAPRHAIDWRQPGTGHVTFSRAGVVPLTVPAHKPVRPIYVLWFVALVNSIGVNNGI